MKIMFQVCEGQPTKATRMMQAEEAVSRIKVQKKKQVYRILLIGENTIEWRGKYWERSFEEFAKCDFLFSFYSTFFAVKALVSIYEEETLSFLHIEWW